MDAETLHHAWGDAGYTTESQSFSPSHRIVTATTESGLVMTYTATADAGVVRGGILADSPCVVADFAEVRERYGEMLRQQSETSRG